MSVTDKCAVSDCAIDCKCRMVTFELVRGSYVLYDGIVQYVLVHIICSTYSSGIEFFKFRFEYFLHTLGVLLILRTTAQEGHTTTTEYIKIL